MRKVLVIVLLLVSYAAFAERTKIGSYEYNGHTCTVYGEYKGEYVNIDGLSRVEDLDPIQFRVFYAPDSNFNLIELVRLAVKNYAIVYIYDENGKHVSTYKNAGSFIYRESYFDLDKYLEKQLDDLEKALKEKYPDAYKYLEDLLN